MMKHFSKLFIAVVIFPFNYVLAQDCSVAVESLKGKYEGECKNGKAEGNGKATGVDTYEGEFKNGLPNGKGKYIWKDGTWYDGQWSKGNKDGYGTMTYKLADKDSIVDGFWKKNVYAGKYEKPYIIHTRTRNVSSVACKMIDDKLNRIELFLNSETAGTVTSFNGGVNLKPELTDVTVLSGTYMKRIENAGLAKKIEYTFEDVVYPFRAIFTMGNEQVEVEIFEAGRWAVDIKLHY